MDLIYFLQPGEIFVSDENIRINTILGSCVAVCMWDCKRKIGGMNHVMLPYSSLEESVSTKYANVASFVLFEMLIKEGCGKRLLKAKIFGGASELSVRNDNFNLGVGSKNIEVTLKSLRKLGVPVLEKDLGGRVGRKISFSLNSGDVRMNYLKKTR